MSGETAGAGPKALAELLSRARTVEVDGVSVRLSAASAKEVAKRRRQMKDYQDRFRKEDDPKVLEFSTVDALEAWTDIACDAVRATIEPDPAGGPPMDALMVERLVTVAGGAHSEIVMVALAQHGILPVKEGEGEDAAGEAAGGDTFPE